MTKVDHGVTKRRKPLTALTQFLPISFTKPFVQPLDRKTKPRRELSTMVRDIYKSTRRIGIQIDSEKLLFAVDVPRISHEAPLRNKLVALNAHNPLSFALKALFHRLQVNPPRQEKRSRWQQGWEPR